MSFRIVGIGEVLWDLLPSGPQLGGAPANFVYHASALGARASLVTRVGNDDLGKTIVERFEQIEIADDTIQVDDVAPTGTVTVALSRDGIPRYLIHENVAWDHLAVTTPALTAVRAADAVFWQPRTARRHFAGCHPEAGGRRLGDGLAGA